MHILKAIFYAEITFFYLLLKLLTKISQFGIMKFMIIFKMWVII